jgi:chromosome segregation ATPase
MILIVLLMILYFRRNLTNAYDICDPLIMVYFDRRVCYKKMTETALRNPEIQKKINELSSKMDTNQSQLETVTTNLSTGSDSLNKMIVYIQSNITGLKSNISNTYDMYLANIKNLNRAYDSIQSRIRDYVLNIKSTLASIQKQYSHVRLYNLSNQSNSNTKMELYLSKSYNAIRDTILENPVFFKQYTSDLDNVPELQVPVIKSKR